MVNRFLNEARAVNHIGSEHIVEIHDFGQTEEGEHFFIMEFLDGRTLAQELSECRVLEVPRALHIGAQIAGALAAAHDVDIIHRDLKPDNVMLIQRLGDPDFVKLLDFGLAKFLTDADARKLTAAGVVLGTPHYMSPEACESKPNVDHRCDVYSLGVLLFQMLTGQLPFTGESMGEILVKQVVQPPPAPRGINPTDTARGRAGGAALPGQGSGGAVPERARAARRAARPGRIPGQLAAGDADRGRAVRRDDVRAVAAHRGPRRRAHPHGQGGRAADRDGVWTRRGARPTRRRPTRAPPTWTRPRTASTPAPTRRRARLLGPRRARSRTGPWPSRRRTAIPRVRRAGCGLWWWPSCWRERWPAWARSSSSARTRRPRRCRWPLARCSRSLAPPTHRGPGRRRVRRTAGEPAEPRQARIRLTTRPPGAEVFDEEGVALGTTPTDITLPIDGNEVVLRFRHPEAIDSEKRFIPTRDVAFDIDLPPVPTAEKLAEDEAGEGESDSTPAAREAPRRSEKRRPRRRKKPPSDDLLVPQL